MFYTVHLSQDSSKLSKYISNTLLDEIERTGEKKEKVLLYLNKRGSYSSLACKDCQHLWECPNCDTSLSIHSHPQRLLCHMCACQFPYPLSCPNCHGAQLLQIGVGTQQIETDLKKYFPEKQIYRFDSDSMKNISSKREALWYLESADIIIGTKMITTGFNFEKVGLIGILLGEQELSYPSYDAEEKAYANLKQLIGRGNRRSQETTLILQTFLPQNPLIQRLLHQNYKDFFTHTLQERKDFFYPPYTEMITLEYRHKESEKALQFTQKLEEKLQEKNILGNYRILRGTQTFKKNNTYHAKIILQGKDLRVFLAAFEKEILSNSALSVIFW